MVWLPEARANISVYDGSVYGYLAPYGLGVVPPRFRLYDPARLLGPLTPVLGQLGAGVGTGAGGSGSGATGDMSTTGGTGATQVVTFPQPPQAGDLLLVAFAWDSVAAGLGASGWTVADQTNSATAAGGIWYRVAAAGDPQSFTFTTTASTQWVAVTMAYRGAHATPLDAVQHSTGSSAAPTTGTTAATAQADEVAIALLVTAVASDGALAFSSGYLEIARVSGPDFTMIVGQRMLNATSTQVATGVSRTLTGYAGVIATFKAAASRPAFAPLGEPAFATGTATMRPYDLGEFEMRVSSAEAAASLLGPNTIVEVYQADDRPTAAPAVNGGFETDTSGWSTGAGTSFVAAGSTFARTTAEHAGGAASARLQTSATVQGVWYALGNLTSGVTYTLHVMLKGSTAGGATVTAFLGQLNAGSYTEDTLAPTGSWAAHTTSWAATGQAAVLGFRQIGAGSTDLYVDDVVLVGEVRPGWTFGWYIVRHLERDETTPTPVVTVRGPDLRALITDRALVQGVLDVQRGSPPANTAVENWVRAYVTASCISPIAQNDYAQADVVPTLVLDTTGNRGTTYANAPGDLNQSVGETITTLYRRDRLGWRLVVNNPGQTNANIQFQTYQGTDRTMGTSSEVVFASQWETARGVVFTDDALPPATTSLTVMAPPAPAARTNTFIEDALSKQRWGQLSQRIDGSFDATATAAPATYLAELTPKQYVTVHVRPGLYAPGRDYGVLDKVSVVLRNGLRVDEYLTSLSIGIRASPTDAAEVGLIAQERAPEPHPGPLPAGVYPFDALVPVKAVVGNDPGIVKKAPDGLPTYMSAPNYTGSEADLNTVAGGAGAAGTTTASKATVVDTNRKLDYLRLGTLRLDSTNTTSPGSSGSIAVPNATKFVQVQDDGGTVYLLPLIPTV